MKTKLSLQALVIALVCLSACTKKPDSYNNQSDLNLANQESMKIFPIFKFTVELHRASLNCAYGFGFCDAHLILLGEEIFGIQQDSSTSGITAGFDAEVLEGNQSIEILWQADASTFFNPDSLNLEVGENVPLPEALADYLGASYAELVNGTYEYQSNLGEYGGYILNYNVIN